MFIIHHEAHLEIRDEEDIDRMGIPNIGRE